MTTRVNPLRIACVAAGLFFFFIFFSQEALAQGAVSKLAKTASPELVGQLTKMLSITPTQASGGAGALFGLAKSRLSPADFGKIAATVPGIDGLIKSAPALSASKSFSGLAGLGGLGGLASVGESFKKLGLSTDMAPKFVSILTKFVEAKGGGGVASILAGALK